MYADPAWLAAGAADAVGQDLVELGAVLFGLGLLGMVAYRLGLSPVPLYLVAGLAFGDTDRSPSPPARGSSTSALRSAVSCCC